MLYSWSILIFYQHKIHRKIDTIKMSKLLTILNIGHKLFYQVYENEKVIGGLEEKTIGANSAVPISEIIRDNRLSSAKEVGVILINFEQKIELALKKEFSMLTKFKIIREFDTYQKTIEGNDLNNSSWCIMDSLTENVKVYGLNEQSKLLILNKSEAENQFFDEVINYSFKGRKPQIIKGEKEKLIREWKVDLNSQEVDGYFTIGGEDKQITFNNSDYVQWTFGSLLNDINRNFSSKQIFYLFGDFLNNVFLINQLEKNGQNKVNYKSEIDAAKFIIYGAIQLCESEADIEIKGIKSKDDPSKIYSKAELNELYESKNIKYFISFKEFKTRYVPTDIDEQAVRGEVVKKIGEQLEIDETTKKQLIETAKERGVGLSFVEAEINKVIAENKKEYDEKIQAKKNEILKIINDYVKNKKITKASSKNKKAILAVINVEGFDIDKEQIVKRQLSDFKIFFTNYRNNPDAITEKSLPLGVPSVEDGKVLIENIGPPQPPIPWKIIVLGLVALVIIGFGGSQLIPNDDKIGGGDNDEQQEQQQEEQGGDNNGDNEPPKPDDMTTILIKTDYASNPTMLKDAFREIHNPSTRSKIAKEIATKVSSDLKIWKVQAKVIEDMGSITTTNDIIYTLKEFTDFIRGDRKLNPQTIKEILINSTKTNNQTIKVTLRIII
jgi:hypothetical protein